MRFDINRINSIEFKLKENIESISNNDLIYYLEYNTHNTNISSTNLLKTEEYFKKINASYDFEDVFVNTSNYSKTLPFIIGLLLPFYYMYPKFYKLGTLGIVIGIVSIFSIFYKINSLYDSFFKNIGIYFFIVTLLFYVFFFIFLNKLNHISLFFISAVIVYFFINYVCKIILTFPIEGNPFNKYRATINSNTNFTPYNLLTESACLELIKRYNLKLPSGNMLYSYLTEFVIENNDDKYSDFLTSLLGPLFSIGILWLLSFFLNDIRENVPGYINKVDDKVNLFPIIGLTKESFGYFTCNANYILPKQLNCDLIIHDLLDKHKSEIFEGIKNKTDIKYNFNDENYKRIQKALLRISNELLQKYSPKFHKAEKCGAEQIFTNLNENKSFIKISTIIEKYGALNNKKQKEKEENLTEEELAEKIKQKLKLTKDNYVDQIKNFLQTNLQIPYSEKEVIFNLLDQINNCLYIENIPFIEENSYKKLANLAIEVLQYDNTKLKTDAGILFEKIAKEFYDNFNNNIIKNKYLYGYENNIISRDYFKSWTTPSNTVFSIILKLISTWLLFAKPFGSSWLLSKYVLIPRFGFRDILKNISNGSFFWKYISLGIDSEYCKAIFESIKNSTNLSFISRIGDIVLTILIYIIIFGLLYFYNSSSFALTYSPAWYNLIFQIMFFGNIIGNIIIYNNKKSNLWFNIIYFGVVLFLAIIITILVIFIKK